MFTHIHHNNLIILFPLLECNYIRYDSSWLIKRRLLKSLYYKRTNLYTEINHDKTRFITKSDREHNFVICVGIHVNQPACLHPSLYVDSCLFSPWVSLCASQHARYCLFILSQHHKSKSKSKSIYSVKMCTPIGV